MAAEEVSVSAHEHIEPNIGNVVIVAVIVIFVLAVLRWGSHRFPRALGGLQGIVG